MLLLRLLLFVLALLPCLALVDREAAAATAVYHSPGDDGLPGSSIAEGQQPVYLYIDGGPAASAPASTCNDGAGDEVCGFDLELTGLNGLTLSGFTPDPSADLVVDLQAGVVRMNGLDTVSPSAGPQRIGELTVNAVAGGELELTSGEVVGADLDAETLSPSTLVTVPEPEMLLMLGAGLPLVAALAKRRRRP